MSAPFLHRNCSIEGREETSKTIVGRATQDMIQRDNAMSTLPKKLKLDTVVEALLEIRFAHQSIGEVVLGQLVAAHPWAGYQTVRLPLADLPAGLRESDPNLRHQPIFQLQRPTPGEIIKIGANVISLHVLSPYPGWEAYERRLTVLVEQLFRCTESPYITRLGLRYINAFSPAHGITSIKDLDFKFDVPGHQSPTELTASYRFNPQPQIGGQVTLASPTFVMGAIPPGTVAFVDIDMSTVSELGHTSEASLLSWLSSAHDAEKEAFFALWPQDKLDALRDE